MGQRTLCVNICLTWVSFDALDFDCAFLSTRDLPFQDTTPKEPKVCDDPPIILLPLILS